MYSLIRGYSSLPPSCKFNLVESLRSNFSVLLPNVDSLTRVSQSQDDEHLVVDRVASHRNAFKIYTFFLINIVLAEESNIVSNNNTKVFSLHYLYFSYVYSTAGGDIATVMADLVKSFGHGLR